MLRKAIDKLIQKISLSEHEMMEAACDLFNHPEPELIASFLVLLKAKGETVDELLGLIQALRSRSPHLTVDDPIIDIVGTGGDRAGTINISTGSALLAAACGIYVVKHGNRAVSSHSGSADVLEKLGYLFCTQIEEIKNSLRKKNFAFCFASDFYPDLKNVRSIRKAIQFPTIFNLAGPLLNPVSIDHLMLGVYDPNLVDLIAEVLYRLGTKKSIVFHGGGIDELSCLGPTKAILVTKDGKETITIDPLQLGLERCTLQDLKGQDALYNAEELKKTFSGKRTPLTDTLILNAGVALFLYGKCPTIQEGVCIARKRLSQGKIIHQKSLKETFRSSKGIIAEIKRASPSAGAIAEIKNPIEKAQEYVGVGALAISVLTNAAFEGSMEDLRKVASSIQRPVLCKDFIFDINHLKEASLAGADAVLLIVKVLRDKTSEFVEMAHRFGMEALVEVHNVEELEIALLSNPDLIGVNQRDLSDFSMHPEIFSQLISLIPPTIVRIAESGVRSKEEADQLIKMGYDGVLVGEALSRKTFFGGSHAR